MVILVTVTNTLSKPIMVSFGTNEGPIIPPPISTTQSVPIRERREPAPVFERREDLPNPAPYKPYIPQQYRSKLLSLRPNPNLILGTAQDQKYFRKGSDKYTLLKQQQARALGLDYRGPQVFEVQDYEFVTPWVNKPLFQPAQQVEQSRINSYPIATKLVPQIGVLYSSGVRYYIPQIIYYSKENPVKSLDDDRKSDEKDAYLLYNTV